MNSLERPTRRAVAVILGLALIGFEPALADEPGDTGAPDEAPSAAPSAPQPASDSALPPSDTAPNRWADGAAKAFDVIPIRLLSATSVVIGFGAFVASVPLVGPGFQLEGIRNSWDYFVVGPYEYTFVRPLGDF